MAKIVQRGLLSEHIKAVLKENHLLTATEIHKYLESKNHIYNKTSVYRCLDKMLKDGEICLHRLLDKKICYELRDDHDHLVCVQCSSVINVQSLYQTPSSVDSFTVAHHHLTLYGVCHECD